MRGSPMVMMNQFPPSNNYPYCV